MPAPFSSRQRRDPYACPIVRAHCSQDLPSNERRWLWAPAFRRDDERGFNCQTARTVIARERSDEAIHLSFCRAMDCFASLAMTLIEFRIRLRPRDARRPRCCIWFPRQRGRGECRAHDAPAVSCAFGSGKRHTSNNEHTEITRHSRTQWFYRFTSYSPRRSGSFATVALRIEG